MTRGDGGFHARQSAYSVGLRCRCPRCGRGKLFQGFLALKQRCEACGLDFSKADSGDGPAVFLIFILGFTVVPFIVFIEFTYEPPVWVTPLLGLVLILGGALLLLRPMKGLMIALQYRHKASDSGATDYE